MLNPPPDRIAVEYRAGATLDQLADRHGVSPQTIRRRLVAAGVELRRYTLRDGARRQHHVDPEAMRRLRAGGASTREIGETLGFPEEVVRKRMIEAGIDRLPGKARPHRNVFFRGGRTWDTGGYVLVLVPAHPLARKGRRYVAEHRLVMEAALGRYLLPTEVVDHRDGDTTNNRRANLRVFPSNAEHLRATLTARKQPPRRSSFDPAGPTPSASETGADRWLRRHPLWPFVPATDPLSP